MEAVAHGDERALSELYDCFERPLFSLGMKWLGDAKMAEDLVQDVTLRIWKGAPTFDSARGEASSWIFGIARNVSIDLFRARRRLPTPVEEVEADPGPQWDEDAARRSGGPIGRRSRNISRLARHAGATSTSSPAPWPRSSYVSRRSTRPRA